MAMRLQKVEVGSRGRQSFPHLAVSPIHCPAKLLLELVELMGIEPVTS